MTVDVSIAECEKRVIEREKREQLLVDMLAMELIESIGVGNYKIATSAALFASWIAYAKAAGVEPGSRKAFGQRLELSGFKSIKVEKGRTRAWAGLCLKADSASRQLHGQDDQG